MSFHFYIKKNKPVSYGQLFYRHTNKNFKVARKDKVDEYSNIDGYHKFYIPKYSTRGVSLYFEDGIFDIGVAILASKEDYILAVETAKALAHLTDAPIEPEDAEAPVSFDEFDENYNEHWAEESKTMGIGLLQTMIMDDDKGSLTLGGCLRNYFIGRETFEVMVKDNPTDETLYERVVESIRRIQFVDEEKYRIPSIYEVSSKDGSKWQYVLLLSDTAQLLVKAEYILLNDNEVGYVKVKYEDFLPIAKKRFERLDEEQFLIEPIPYKDFIKLMKGFGYVPTTNGNRESLN